MTYKDAQELEAGLRELADFVRDHGVKLPTDISLYSSNFLYDDWQGKKGTNRTAKEKAGITARVLAKGGRAEKNFQGNYLELVRKFGPIKIEFNINRELVCEKRVVEVVEVPEHVIAAHTREVVEWDCIDPLLKAS